MKTNTKWKYDFGKRMKDARIAAGLRQTQAARILECSQSYISIIESGSADPPSGEFIAQVCDAYAVDANWLVGLHDETDLDPAWIEQLKKLSPADRVKTAKLLSMIGQ
ncbi:MAG TPA: helix-turn-helix transcriptional regulator [Candidatus Obscuribacterales bacterium]